MLCRPLSIRPMFKSVSNRTFSCVRPRSRRTAFNLSTTCFTNKSLRLCRFILQITAIMSSVFTTFLCEGGGNFRVFEAISTYFLSIPAKNIRQTRLPPSSFTRNGPSRNTPKATRCRTKRARTPPIYALRATAFAHFAPAPSRMQRACGRPMYRRPALTAKRPSQEKRQSDSGYCLSEEANGTASAAGRTETTLSTTKLVNPRQGSRPKYSL